MQMYTNTDVRSFIPSSYLFKVQNVKSLTNDNMKHWRWWRWWSFWNETKRNFDVVCMHEEGKERRRSAGKINTSKEDKYYCEWNVLCECRRDGEIPSCRRHHGDEKIFFEIFIVFFLNIKRKKPVVYLFKSINLREMTGNVGWVFFFKLYRDKFNVIDKFNDPNEKGLILLLERSWGKTDTQ